MKVEYINPFIESVQEFFTTMLSASITRGEVGVARHEELAQSELTALIGISGPTRGTVAVALSGDTAKAILKQMLSMDFEEVDDTVIDGIAEVINIIAGNAKARLTNVGDVPLDLSLPTVVRGSDYTVEYPTGTIWVEVPFSGDMGGFHLRVTLESEGDK